MPVIKTGKQWNDEINVSNGYTIVDPDGWDRTNNSYEKDFITKAEFHKRSLTSTVVPV